MSSPLPAEVTARYARPNALIWAALTLAYEPGISTGVGHDPTDPAGWDGHSTTTKYERVVAFADVVDPVAGR